MLRMRKKVKSFIPELKDAYEILIERINKIKGFIFYQLDYFLYAY
jgi:hypothetical protein